MTGVLLLSVGSDVAADRERRLTELFVGLHVDTPDHWQVVNDPVVEVTVRVAVNRERIAQRTSDADS